MEKIRGCRIAFSLIALAFFYSHYAFSTEGDKYWHEQERVLRYRPEGDAFMIHNGDKRFTRAIYGTNTAFRLETSDFPEFGLYMPNFGGSAYLVVSTPDTLVWIKDLESITSSFVSGMRSWKITDRKILGKGEINISVLAMSDADGILLKTDAKEIKNGTSLILIYGGANDKKFSRNGDLGVDPQDCFYIEPDKCKGDDFTINKNEFLLHYGKKIKSIRGVFPEKARLSIVDGRQIENISGLFRSEVSDCPLLCSEMDISGNKNLLAALYNPESTDKVLDYSQLSGAYGKADEFRTEISGRVKIETPDPFFNTLGGIFSGAEDAIWQRPSYLHGAIGWRIPLPGWRGAYVADVFGLHNRARTHFDAYAASQITEIPVTLPHSQDKATYLSRSEKKWGTPMYSNGYITRNPDEKKLMNHYDMNLVYIDELLWHLSWTGDQEYAKKIFPVIKRHLAWEKQTFDPDSDGLYDGYACIWASDGLQYDGGSVTHSTAYNYRANLLAAMIAEKINEDPSQYKLEADHIIKALDKALWIKDKGWWAEFRDNMGNKMLHEDAAVWTIYHAIDSGTGDPFMNYEATRYIDTNIPHIPVRAKGLSDTTSYVISTSDWQPYMWSINNVAFAEIAHTALAYWQAGRYEEAFRLYKGAVLDAMYLGSGPGNITQTSFYDAAKGETYRDFADPVGIASRALVQGLFGIIPDLLNDRLIIRPGFPDYWNNASIQTMNMYYKFTRNGLSDNYIIKPYLKKKAALTLELNARMDSISSVVVNGLNMPFKVDEKSISRPRVIIDTGSSDSYEITVNWAGDYISETSRGFDAASGYSFCAKFGENILETYDPQSVLDKAVKAGNELSGRVIGAKGHRTIFLKIRQGSMSWWLPVDINVTDPVEVVCKENPERFGILKFNLPQPGNDINLQIKNISNLSKNIHDIFHPELRFEIVNNAEKTLKGDMYLNYSSEPIGIDIPAKSSCPFAISSDNVMTGTNRIDIKTADGKFCLNATDWNIRNAGNRKFEDINLGSYFNDKVSNIFEYGKYLLPRWPYTTLQVPTQGMGQWCKPDALSKIDDRGLRKKAESGNVFVMPQGIPFMTPGDTASNNVIFTSLWDNYPDSVKIILSGKSSHAYMLVAASTYYMQDHVINGKIKVTYKDGSKDVLDLVLPENLLPIDQDIYTDGYAFRLDRSRLYRISLKTGEVSRNPGKNLGLKMSSGEPLTIDGGLATLIDMPLNPSKELKNITLITTANEVITGLMAITLER